MFILIRIFISMDTLSSSVAIYRRWQNFLSKKVTVHSLLALLVKRLVYACWLLEASPRLPKYITFLCGHPPIILRLEVQSGTLVSFKRFLRSYTLIRRG